MLSAAFNTTVASLPADFIINSIGIAVFAVTGVLAGAKKGMDLFGIVVLALITAFGGGTIRDIILDAPVFWVENFSYVYISFRLFFSLPSYSNIASLPKISVNLAKNLIFIFIFRIISCSIISKY